MRILALETSGLAGSVAACEDDRLLLQTELDPATRSARTLAHAVQELLAAVGWQGPTIDLVAVGSGPGSFTGLRVGVTTAKVLAYAWRCRLVGVDTLEAVARHLYVRSSAGRVAVVLDAGRGQVFAGDFRRSPTGGLEPDLPTRLVDATAWLASLKAGDMVAGPALAQLAPQLPACVRVASPELWPPRAWGVALAAFERYKRGEYDDPFTLVPRYLRPSAAEEKAKGSAQAAASKE